MHQMLPMLSGSEVVVLWKADDAVSSVDYLGLHFERFCFGLGPAMSSYVYRKN
jgi:hypothetical protein